MIETMLKRIMAGALAALLCAIPALAEVYSGVTVATDLVVVTADSNAQVEQVRTQVGSMTAQGEVLATLRSTKVFAQQNGCIARIHAEEGQQIDGCVLELQPVSRYDIYCTVSEAYASAEAMLVHSGETLYLRCTANGTHQGMATVTSIDGETYMAEATGGEFYNGETVYLYRNSQYDYSSLVGIGTVVAAQTEAYASEGKVIKLHVEEGEYVERGELLYEIIDGDSCEILAPADGVITQCLLHAGESIAEGERIFTIASPSSIRIEIEVDAQHAAKLCVGDSVELSYACDAQETLVPGEISEISRLGEDDAFSVRIQPQSPPPYLGMTVNVQIGE